jgi:hypothetical protein
LSDAEKKEPQKKKFESPEVTFKKIGRQDAEDGLPSRHMEIEEHFRTAYRRGYEEAQQEIQEKLKAAALSGHHLFQR